MKKKNLTSTESKALRNLSTRIWRTASDIGTKDCVMPKLLARNQVEERLQDGVLFYRKL